MIIMRKASEEDKKILFSFYDDCPFFKNLNIPNNICEFIVALDNKVPIGYSQINFNHNKLAEISAIYINEKERLQGLGDGILRTALNYIESKGCQWAIIRGDKKLDDFLYKEGLQPLNKLALPNEIIQYLEKHDSSTTFFCDIPSFFNRGCKNKNNIWGVKWVI